MMDSKPGTKLIIYPLFQFFSGFEERKFLRLDGDPLTGLGISTGIALILLYKKAAEPPNFNSLALCMASAILSNKIRTTLAASDLEIFASFFKVEMISNLFIHPP